MKWIISLLLFASLISAEIPPEIQKIIDQKKYDHAIWGLYVKDLETGKVLYDLNSNKLFSPASTSKLFSTASLLSAFGDDYRFKTPVYATGTVSNGVLEGNLVLVAQGDLTLGGRQKDPNTIEFTKMDHIVANEVPGVILTKEDPLFGLNELAKQVAAKGINKVNGDVVIDDSLFETIVKRGFTLSPIFINENLIDLIINPSEVGSLAKIDWRPEIKGYKIDNQVKTVKAGEETNISVTSDESGKNIIVKGAIAADQKDIIRVSYIKDPKAFAREAFIEALDRAGVKVNPTNSNAPQTVKDYQFAEQVALLTSPPLSEYVKLILKVSHNIGADLIPLLLASSNGKKTFDEGMVLFGNFVHDEVKLPIDNFVFIDAAGGNENRLSPQGEVTLLEYMKKQPHYKKYLDALPILGKDGSLEDFAKNSPGAGKVYSKPGTGVAFNLATQKLFLITQALAGYILGKNGHTYAYMVVVNNATMPTIDDIFPIFEDESQISSHIYDHTNE